MHNTAPRAYATIGSCRGPRSTTAPFDSDFVLTAQHTKRDSSEDGRDIQVVTDIVVRVEGNDGAGREGRKGAEKEWGVVGVSGKSSTETLVKDAARVV